MDKSVDFQKLSAALLHAIHKDVMMSASQIKKLLHIILAALLITVGLFGLVLPVLNGIIPITIGLILLSFESKYIESLLERITKKNKHVDHWYQRLAKRLKKILRD